MMDEKIKNILNDSMKKSGPTEMIFGLVIAKVSSELNELVKDMYKTQPDGTLARAVLGSVIFAILQDSFNADIDKGLAEWKIIQEDVKKSFIRFDKKVNMG